GSGVLVVLPEGCAEEHLEQALLAAKTAIVAPEGTRFVVVQHDRGAAGLAKTLQLEAPHLRTTIVHLPASPDSDEQAVGRVVAEVASTTRFAEVFYDENG